MFFFHPHTLKQPSDPLLLVFPSVVKKDTFILRGYIKKNNKVWKSPPLTLGNSAFKRMIGPKVLK